MKTLLISTIAIVVILFGAKPSPAAGQPDQATSDQWQFQFTPYAWLPGINANGDLGGLTGAVDVGADDVIDVLDFGGAARFEAWKKRWGLFVDTMYMALSDDYGSTVGPRGGVTLNADVDVRLGLVDFGVAYRLIDTPVGRSGTQRLVFEPLAGLRYGYLKEEVKLNVAVAGVGAAGRTLGGDEDWIEPLVGGRVWWHINEKLSAGVRGDIGGFGLGSASTLTWNFLAGVDVNLKKNTSLRLGYRIMGIDYHGGSGSSRIGLDGKAEGPIIGLTWRF